MAAVAPPSTTVGGAPAAAAAQPPSPPPSACGTSIVGALQRLVASLVPTGSPAAHKQLLGAAWTVLLDRQDSAPPPPPDVRDAAAEAYDALRAQRRGPEAQELAAAVEALLQRPQPDDAQAVLALLLALRGSSGPRRPPAMAALPALGSAPLAQLQRRAQDAPLAAAAAPDAPRSWVSPAAAALELLQAVPLDAAAGGGGGARHAPAAREGAGSLFDAAARSMARAADASRLGQPLAAPAHGDAAAAAPAAAVQPAVLPLMALASAQPAADAALTLPGWLAARDDGQQPHDGDGGPDAARRASSSRGGGWLEEAGVRYRALSRSVSGSSGGGVFGASRRTTLDSICEAPDGAAAQHHKLQPSGGAGAARDTWQPRDQQQPAASAAGSRAAAEGELVSLACLAVQGVWSAAAQLWHLAVGSALEGGGGGGGRRAGLARGAAQQALLLQLLHVAELRLRVVAFAQHFGSSGGGARPQAPELGCFLAAVRQLLDMHGAALQQLQARLREQRRAGSPPTLLALLAALRGVRGQLQLLAALCWCRVDEFLEQRLYISSSAAHALGALSLPAGLGSSSDVTAHLLQQAGGGGGAWRRRRGTLGSDSGGDASAVAAAAAVLAAATAAHGVAPLPWGGEPAAAVMAQRFGWAPSDWQLRGGFLEGHALLERLHGDVLAAPPEAAPLLRHLFAAAMQPVLHAVRTWGLVPSTAAAEAAATAAALASAHGGSSLCVAAAASDAQTGLPGSGGGPAGAAASACLLRAWEAARSGGPRLPGFLAALQPQLDTAGAQLQLLQLLGGCGQQLAERLGWLAELEQQELREALAAAGGDGQAAASADGVAFTPSGARSYLPVNLSVAQLQQCAAILADYEAARAAELSRVLSDLAAQRAAGDAARAAREAARLDARAAADEQRQQLALEAAARRRQRQQRLLAAQQAQLSDAAARRAAARLDELTFERSLLRGAAVAEHEAALQQLHGELALDAAAEQPAAAAAPQHAGDAAGEAADAAGDAAALEAAAGDVVGATAALEDAAEQLLAELEDDAAGSDLATVADDQPAAVPAEQPAKERGTWGRPVADIGPAAGRPSGQGALGADGGAAAAVPAAGRRSNSQPRVLPGMGRQLSAGSSPSTSRRSSAADEARSIGGILGRPGGGAWGSALSGRSSGGGSSQAALLRGRWGLPVVPGPAAGGTSGAASKAWRSTTGGILGADSGGGGDSSVAPGRPLSARRLSELGGAAALQLLQQQQREQQAPPGELAVYAALQQQDAAALLPEARARGAANAAAASGRSGASGQQQQQEEGNVLLLDWLLQQQGACSADGRACRQAAAPHALATAARASSTGRPQVAPAAASQGAGERGDGDAAAASAPPATVLEVLLSQPLLSQHRLTTAACWGLLLRQHRLLPRLAAVQGFFFQQAGDWAALLCDGLEAALAAPRAGGGGLSPVALQLLLESALQQSSLAAAPEGEALCLAAEAGRCLPGWSSPSAAAPRGVGSGLAARAAAAAAASDVLLLRCAAPWPLSLLLGPRQLARYADVFGVLLRVRRLQQLLMQQWQPLNARPGGAASCSRRGKGAPRRAAGAAEHGAGLARVRELRQWHALALHGVEALLGHMLGELCGTLWASFEAELTGAPLSLPAMLAAHERLLAAAARVCLLPEVDAPEEHAPEQAPGASLAAGVRALMQCGWQLQLQVAGLLDGAASAGSDGGGGVCAEGASARPLGAALADECAWAELAANGRALTRTLGWLRRQLADGAAATPGHPLAGLAARLGA